MSLTKDKTRTVEVLFMETLGKHAGHKTVLH